MTPRKLIALTILTALFSGSVGAGLVLHDAGAALAQGKSGNNGNGNGNGNGNSGNDNAGNGNGGNNGRGAVASELKGLNAANANEQAFLNAASNSRVGQVAAYRDAVLASRELLDALNAQGISPDDFDPNAILTTDEIAAYQAALDASSEGYDPAAAQSVLELIGYDDFAALDPAAADYQAQYDALLASLTSEAETRLQASQQLVDYFEATGTEAEIYEQITPEGGLSEAAQQEFWRILGL